MPSHSEQQQRQQQRQTAGSGSLGQRRGKVPAELQEQQHFERRLLEQLERRVRLTGELPYNEFYELAQATFERQQSPRQATLPRRTVQNLSKQLDRAVDSAIYWARAIEGNLREVGDSAQRGSDVINRESAVRDNINNSVRCLTREVDFLLDVADKYGLLEAGANQGHPGDKGKRQEGAEDSDSSQSPQRLKKLKHDVRYLQRYVSEQGQVQTIKSELQPEDDSERYFRRLRRYLEILPDYCSDLGEALKLALQDQAITAQVCAPHRR